MLIQRLLKRYASPSPSMELAALVQPVTDGAPIGARIWPEGIPEAIFQNREQRQQHDLPPAGHGQRVCAGVD